MENTKHKKIKCKTQNIIHKTQIIKHKKTQNISSSINWTVTFKHSVLFQSQLPERKKMTSAMKRRVPKSLYFSYKQLILIQLIFHNQVLLYFLILITHVRMNWTQLKIQL